AAVPRRRPKALVERQFGRLPLSANCPPGAHELLRPIGEVQMRALSLFIGSIVVSVVTFTSSALGVGANAHVTRDDAASSYLRYDGSSDARSEERRVGKEWRSRGGAGGVKEMG